MKRRIVLLGPPASGKGTQAEMITARYGISIISPGAILREESRKGSDLGIGAERLTTQGKLLPDQVIIELIETWLSSHDAEFVFDGFPRSLGQADALEETLRVRGVPLAVVIALEANLETLQQRVAFRMVCERCGQIVSVGLHVEHAASSCPKCGGVLGRRADDTPETLAARMIEYSEKTEPLLAYYESRGLLRKVDSAQKPKMVFAAVSAILEGA